FKPGPRNSTCFDSSGLRVAQIHGSVNRLRTRFRASQGLSGTAPRSGRPPADADDATPDVFPKLWDASGEPSLYAVAVALTAEYDGVFRAARQRAAWYFTLRLLIAIATCLLFLGGAVGAVMTAVATGVNIWSAVFGGMSVVGAFGLFISRPL